MARLAQVREGYSGDELERRLVGRRWREVRDLWVDAPLPLSEPGEIPDAELWELPGVEETTRLLWAEKGSGTSINDVPGLPQLLYRLSVFGLHRAARVVSGAELHVAAGLPTWSVSSAYQGAFFSALGVLGLLGIGLFESLNRQVVVDVFQNASASRGASPPLFIRVGVPKADHLLVWGLFLRTIRSLTVPEETVPRRTKNLLGALKAKEFARPRNQLHYRSNHWPLGDLQQALVVKEFGVLPWSALIDSAELDPDREDFALFVAFAILRLGAGLLEDLGRTSEIAAREWGSFRSCLARELHPLQFSA